MKTNKKNVDHAAEIKRWNQRLVKEGFGSEVSCSTVLQPQKIGLETKYKINHIDISRLKLSKRDAYTLTRYNEGISLRAIERELKQLFPMFALSKSGISLLIRKYRKDVEHES